MSSVGTASYAAELVSRGGRIRLADMQNVSSVTWERKADDTSTATVVALLKDQSTRCVNALADAYAWAHEVRLYRNGERIWEGPLVKPTWTRDSVSLACRDVSAWLDHRTTHADYSQTAVARDLTVHAQWLLEDAFGADDPSVLAHLLVRPAGVAGTYSAVAGTVNAGTEFRNFAQAGMDWTVVGRRIVLFGPASQLGRTAELTEEDFVTDALSVTQDGTLACTRALVVSQDPTFEEGETVPLVVRGQWGDTAPDPSIGLHETTIVDDAQVPPGEVAAQATAAALVRGSNPIPVYVTAENGAQLAPCAPVGVQELVPGVYVPVSVSVGGRRVRQTMQLVSVQATWSSSGAGEGGENLTVDLASLGQGAGDAGTA